MPTDERVLVIPTERFRQAGEFTGFLNFTESYRDTLLDSAAFEFRPRSEVEDDPEFKQLIPYVVLRHAGRLFHYTRGGSGTETRLRAKRSLGIGGHINETDTGDVYRAGMLRELTEEVDIRGGWVEHDLGFIYDPTTFVGSVHLGVVHLFELETDDVTPREAGLIETGFAEPAVLAHNADAFESWSQLVLTALTHS